MPTVEPLVASAKATLTAFDKSYKDADKKIAKHSKEFFGVRNLDEAQVYFSTLPAVHHHRLVEKLVGMAVEGTDADVQLVAELLTWVVSKGFCSIEALKDGFRPLIEILRDMTIDALTAPEKMTNMVGMMKAARPDSKTSITRSDIWYEDGSVVLQAQHTQFRVHWGVLARQSSFFHDMQGLPQPPDQPSVDGCPVVKLPDDIADIECLLKALYSPTFLAQAALPLPAIGALIRLGRKYDFRDLLDSAVRRLEFENPKTLEEYEALKAPATNGKTYNPTRIVDYPGILIDLLTLARENDIVSVLPCAYYRVVAHYTPAKLFDGVPRGDGTTASLPPKHLRRCILARDKFISARFQEGYPLGWLKKWDHDSDCANPAKCAQARSARVYSCLNSDPLLNLYRSDEDQKVLCSACYRRATESIRAGRKKLWEDLPKFFDLLPWSELKNDL